MSLEFLAISSQATDCLKSFNVYTACEKQYIMLHICTAAQRRKCAMPDQAGITYVIVPLVSLANTTVSKPETAQNDPFLAETVVGKPRKAQNDPFLAKTVVGKPKTAQK